MLPDKPDSPTDLLRSWRGAQSRDAFDRLVTMLYDELQRIARGAMRRERPDHTLQTGALLHEAYVRASNVPTLTRVGPYRILRELGAGGMGTVFLAERDDEFHQRVAIKVVRGMLSREVLTRFRAERQILASLEHPAIARLLDGGTTPSGLPYLVMEYVDGVSIDEYCRERRLGIRDRLALFARVCDGVSYAHRSLVVHRDLKPSNILVTADGTPKLLDFGIAKLLEPDAGAAPAITITGLRALTPEYASPEQIRGQPITTATDVYSLGVLLFELLTGRRPLAFATQQPAEVERVVCTVEPRKPSTVAAEARQARQLVGDLDTIVLTALNKEPARRYHSAAHLAEDIGRYMNGLPIVARPATWRYRSSRFVKRHRVSVAVATVFACVVVGFAVALAVQLRQVERERDAQAQVSRMLLELYAALSPTESRGERPAPEVLLDRGVARIQRELKDQPDLQARMLDGIGTLYLGEGLNDRAVDVLQSSLEIRRSTGSGATLDAANTLSQLATSERSRGNYADAERLAQQALEIRRRLAGPRAPETAESLDALGSAINLQGRSMEGAAALTEALGIWRATRGVDGEEFASTLLNLLRAWRERADYLTGENLARAELLKVEKFERDRLAVRRKAFGDVHLLTTNSLSALSLLLRVAGRAEEGEPLAREALDLRRQLFRSDDNAAVIEIQRNLALVLHDAGNLVEAESQYRQVVDAMRRTLPRHPQLGVDVNNLATLLVDQGRLDEAIATFGDAAAQRTATLGPDHAAVARTLDNLARALLARGRFAEAASISGKALTIRRAKLGEGDYETAASMVTEARALVASGRAADALPLLRAGHAIRVAALPAGDPRLRDEAQLLSSLR